MPSDITLHPDIALRSPETEDKAAIACLHARVFGPGRFVRSAYRLREAGPPESPFCLVAETAGRLKGAVRFTPVTIGGTSGALLLGPLAVDPAYADQGIGRALVGHGLSAARTAGVPLVILVGDTSYYGRFGFAIVPPAQILLPGPVDPARLLAAALAEGALARFAGIAAADTSWSRDETTAPPRQ